VIALVICRFAHFAATMLAFGASAFVWLYFPDRLRRRLSPAVRPIVAASSVVALISAMAWLALESASMAGDWSGSYDPAAIGAVLADTAFGKVWALRLLLAAAFVALLFVRRDRWGEITMLTAALLASLALVGHSAMRTGFEGVAQRANHAAHLLTAGAWLGGLIPFALCLRAYADNDLRPDTVDAMTRFSFWGQFVVAAIVMTGAINVALISGQPPLPATTPYRALLDVKIIAVGVMISLAAFNRFYLAPRLTPGAPALALLRATSAIEVALGTVVVALVSVFALLDPA
jgi:copper resistance protein D